jgi:hypothetical protein
MTGPDTKYMMQWCGKWRPVIHMYDAKKVQTTLATRAAIAVLWCNEPPDYGYVPLAVNPGDIVERPGRDPSKLAWEYID